MLDKLKNLLPAMGPILGFLGFGQAQGILIGILSALVFLGGMSVGTRLGFREGYKEGQKSCEREENEGGRRRLWPWREGLEDVDMQPIEAAVPIQ